MAKKEQLLKIDLGVKVLEVYMCMYVCKVFAYKQCAANNDSL